MCHVKKYIIILGMKLNVDVETETRAYEVCKNSFINKVCFEKRYLPFS
jgi:hypothetical protein